MNFPQISSYLKAPVVALAAAERSTLTNATLDLAGSTYSGLQGEIIAVILNGVTSGTTPTLDVKVQDSADNITFTDLGFAAAQITVADIVRVISFPSEKSRRYLRFVCTITGTVPKFNFGIVLLYGVKQP